jgi:cell division septal protein FtsQ
MVQKNFLKKTDKKRYAQPKGINFLKILYWLFLLVFCGVVAYIFLFSGFLNILTIEFSPTKKINVLLLENKLNSILAEKYFNLVPRNNLLLLRENQLNNLFTREFGLVKKIKITKKFPDKIIITAEERNPIIILENSQGRFILDDESNTYPDNFFDTSGFDAETLPILKEENSERAFSFDNNSGRDYLDFIFGVKDKLENLLDIRLKKTIIAPQIISGDAFFETEEGWRIYFNKNVALDKEIAMLRIVLEEKIGQDKLKDLEYIDLRIDNKVFYKFKNVQPENTPVEKAENGNQDKKKN